MAELRKLLVFTSYSVSGILWFYLVSPQLSEKSQRTLQIRSRKPDSWFHFGSGFQSACWAPAVFTDELWTVSGESGSDCLCLIRSHFWKESLWLWFLWFPETPENVVNITHFLVLLCPLTHCYLLYSHMSSVRQTLCLGAAYWWCAFNVRLTHTFVLYWVFSLSWHRHVKHPPTGSDIRLILCLFVFSFGCFVSFLL